MNDRSKKILFLAILFVILFVGNSVFSAYDFSKDGGLNNIATQTGHLDSVGKKASFFGGETDPLIIAGKVIKAVLSLLGVIFLVLMIYGGYIWMLARGNDQEVEKAKNIIKNAIIGLIVVLAAYAITAVFYDLFFSVQSLDYQP